MKRTLWTVVALFAIFLPIMAFAQDAVQEISTGAFLDQVMDAVRGFGGFTWITKISTIVLLVVASFKVTALKKYWDKLGRFKPAAAPVLGLISGLLTIGATHNSLPTLSEAMAYVAAGSGAILLSEFLDMLKGIPKIGPTWITIINVVQNALGSGVKLKKASAKK